MRVCASAIATFLVGATALGLAIAGCFSSGSEGGPQMVSPATRAVEVVGRTSPAGDATSGDAQNEAAERPTGYGDTGNIWEIWVRVRATRPAVTPRAEDWHRVLRTTMLERARRCLTDRETRARLCVVSNSSGWRAHTTRPGARAANHGVLGRQACAIERVWTGYWAVMLLGRLQAPSREPYLPPGCLRHVNLLLPPLPVVTRGSDDGLGETIEPLMLPLQIAPRGTFNVYVQWLVFDAKSRKFGSVSDACKLVVKRL